MVQLNGKCMKEHFGIGISFNIIGGIVQFSDNGFLLGNVAELIESQGKTGHGLRCGIGANRIT